MNSVSSKTKSILFISIQDNLSAIGLKYLHYSLLDKGYPSHLLYLPHLDLNNHLVLENIKNFILQINPSFIGISLMSTEYEHACNISMYLKSHFPSIPIIWGGVHPTIAPETCFPFADYVCIGEGERAALDLADSLTSGQDIKKIPNLCYQVGGLLKKNPMYPLINSLDELPCLDHIPRNAFIQKTNSEILPIDKTVFRKEARYQGKMYEVIISRGCAFSCTYCCNNFFSKLYGTRKIRRRKVENIIFELEKAIKNNPEITMVHIQDDSFMACEKEFLIEFCKSYSDKIRRPFIVHSIPIYVSLEGIESLKKAGLAWINLGLQSGSDHVCTKIYKRNSLRNDFLKAAEVIKKFKVAGKHDVILDNPFESEQEKFETIETLIATPKPFLIEFFSLTLYPGTELYKKACTEYPQIIEDYFKKDYLRYKSCTLNKITTLAVCTPTAFIKKLLQLYKVNPQKMHFRIMFFIAMILLKIYYKPITYLKILKLAHEDSYIKMLWNLPMYVKEAFTKRL